MYRVLVADDEPIERMVVLKMIQKCFAGQLEVAFAENGREAVQIYEEKNCQIALLDIEMPGMNGLAAAAEIRKRHRDSCIVFLTAYDEFNYAKSAITVRALDYLLKPAPEEELTAVLEEAIRMLDDKEHSSEREAEHAGNHSVNQKKNEHDNDETAGELRTREVAEMIRNYVEQHYQEDIALQDVARIMNYSDAYFCKVFKQCFGRGFVSYLTWFRLEKAKEMLADVRVNIKDISVQTGYRDANYFAKVFKRMVGATPSEYRADVLRKKEQGDIYAP